MLLRIIHPCQNPYTKVCHPAGSVTEAPMYLALQWIRSGFAESFPPELAEQEDSVPAVRLKKKKETATKKRKNKETR